MLDKLFGWGKKKAELAPAPDVTFGRYSDNNKTLAKTQCWTDADNLFKEKKYLESFDSFFKYLSDEKVNNVVYERNGNEGRFQLHQGSKIVRGQFTNEELKAEVTLARMPQPNVAVMRRLLEMNFVLYYSRFAMDGDRLCMRFDSDIQNAGSSKLYYGLKELSTKADKQDDLLVQDFTTLENSDSEHLAEIPLAEREIKYEYLQKWIQQTLDTVNSVDADKFAGGISYLLLGLIYRIDYLLAPEGKVLSDLEKITGIYFKKDEKPVVEKNRDMIEAFKKLQATPKDEFFKSLIKGKYTFSIVAPQVYKTVADAIHGANQNMIWYRDNNYPVFATQIVEYGLSFCQYSYSLPKVITDLFHLLMMVNYSDYFTALGFPQQYYNTSTGVFEREDIIDKVNNIQAPWREKYPLLDFKTGNLRFDNLVNFNWSFTNEMEFLNLDPK